MSTNEMVLKLKDAAKKDKALDAFMHVCAMRERARGSITLQGMALRMKSEGFNFTKEEYVRVLNTLSDVGLGRLTKTKSGNLALIDIKIAIQTLGAAVVGKGSKVEEFKPQAVYKKLPSMPNTIVAPVEMTKGPSYGAGAETGKRQGFPVSITVLINGKPVNFRVDPSLDTSEIAEVVARFRDHGWGKEFP